jgi:hypothetical protein
MMATLQESFKGEISALQIMVKANVRLENQKLRNVRERESEIF